MITKQSKFRNITTGKVVTVKKIEKRGRWTYITTEAGEMEETSFNKSYAPLLAGDPKAGSTPEAEAIPQDNLSTSPVQNTTPRADDKVRRQDNGDRIAEALRSATSVEQIWSVPLVVGFLDVPALKAKYGHLSPGLVRMNVGNMLRKAIERLEAMPEGPSAEISETK